MELPAPDVGEKKGGERTAKYTSSLFMRRRVLHASKQSLGRNILRESQRVRRLAAEQIVTFLLESLSGKNKNDLRCKLMRAVFNGQNLNSTFHSC